ncbi:MAG: hypothetical protein WC365_07250 [Candidatus Babeliales bacterium]|jgi:hypothetical protein
MKFMIKPLATLLCTCSYGYGALQAPKIDDDFSFKFIKIFYHKCSKQSVVAQCKKAIKNHIVQACDVRDIKSRKSNFHMLIARLRSVTSVSFDWPFAIGMLQIIKDELASIAQRTDMCGNLAQHKLKLLVAFEKELLSLAPTGVDVTKLELLIPHEPMMFAPKGTVLLVDEDDDWTPVDKEERTQDEDKDCDV